MHDLKLFTLGHSNNSSDDFVNLLNHYGIKVLVDIRMIPFSSRYSHFSQDALRSSMERNNIIYHWAGRQLGGRRKPNAESIHRALQDDALRGYADHMQTDGFKKSASQLMQLAASHCLAIMCAEKSPQHCHRNLLADYLSLQAVKVIHAVDVKENYLHQISPLARRESAKLIYDRFVTDTLF